MPFEIGQIVFTRVSRHIKPARSASRGEHHSDISRGVALADLRIFERLNIGIETGGVVDEREVGFFLRLEPPVSDHLAVGAPAEAVAEVEFFLVNPVERPLDHAGLARRTAHFNDSVVAKILDEDGVVANVSRAEAVGRELGEHQRRLGGAAAEFPQLAAPAVEHPVITSRVLPPDALAVGEDQELRPILRKRIILNVQGPRATFWHKPRRAHDHFLRARGRIVADQVVAADRV